MANGISERLAIMHSSTRFMCVASAAAVAATGFMFCDVSAQSVVPGETSLSGPSSSLAPASQGGADDPFLRLPDTSALDDPLTYRQRRTSRTAEGGNQAIAVLDRKRKFYDPVGLPVGTFRFYPEITAGANGTNNVFSQSDGVSDAFLSMRGDIALKSDWTRHLLLVDGYVAKDLHADYTSENNFSYRAHAIGRLDFGDKNSLTLQGVEERVVLDRGSTGDIIISRQPIHYNHSGVDLGAKLGGRGRFTAKLNFAYDDRNYADGKNLDGTVLDQSFRSYQDYIATGQIGYKIGASKAIFFSASQMWRRFDITRGDSRDVDVREFLLGIEGDVTPVIRGRFGVGYLNADFISPFFKSTDGLAIDARLDFMVTELTTVKLIARRDLRNVAGVTAGAAITTVAKLSIDHEFLRNVIISPGISYEYADYVDSNRTANLFSADTMVRWLINPRLRASLTMSYRKRRAENFLIGRDFSAFNAGAGLTWQF